MKTDYELIQQYRKLQVTGDQGHVILTIHDTEVDSEHMGICLSIAEADRVIAAMLEFMYPTGPIPERFKPTGKDACSDAVDMDRISPAEIRGHWKENLQLLRETVRQLNFIERNTSAR